MQMKKKPTKKRRVKGSSSDRRGLARRALTARRPSGVQPLEARERTDLLRYATELKRKGIAPDALLRDQLRAEEALHQMGYEGPLDSPRALRLLVGHPWLPDVDALDAPSLRLHLIRARAQRRLFGHRYRPADSIDLDACGEAFRLRPTRGGQLKPEIQLEIDISHYVTYLLLQQMFATATGTAVPDPGHRQFAAQYGYLLTSHSSARIDEGFMNLLVENRAPRTASSPKEGLNDTWQAATSQTTPLLEQALSRQIEAFNSAKEKRLPSAPGASERCALALLEVVCGRPPGDEQLPAALTYVHRLQRSLRLVKERVNNPKPKKGSTK
jgi:hypothetical protein